MIDNTGVEYPAEEVFEDTTVNEVSGGYGFVGFATDLSRAYRLLVRGQIIIISIDNCRNDSVGTNRIILRYATSGEMYAEYWTSNYWANKLREAAGMPIPETPSLLDSEELAPTDSSVTEEILQVDDESDSSDEEVVVPIIPPNSPTLLIDETVSRFSGAIWYEAIIKKEIILAGLGGIGSYVAFLLSRLKPCKLYMFDPDIVESGNMSGQLYSQNDVGSTKVSSISNMLNNYSNYYGTYSHSGRYTTESIVGSIMICGFDNMEARKIFFGNWSRFVAGVPSAHRKNCLFIDGRLASEEFQIFCIQGDDERSMKLYREEWLFDDSEAEETLCSYKQTTFMANMIGSVMVNLFVNFVANECDPVYPRELPFMTTYDASTMYFKAH